MSRVSDFVRSPSFVGGLLLIAGVIAIISLFVK